MTPLMMHFKPIWMEALVKVQLFTLASLPLRVHWTRSHVGSVRVHKLCDSPQSRCSQSFPCLGSSAMLRPAALGFLLACAASLSRSATVLENGMPVGWAQAARRITELPTRNEIVTPDPWHLPNRTSLYRLMIAATDPFMGPMGTNATDSPLWGLALQLGWMSTSGKTTVISFYVLFTYSCWQIHLISAGIPHIYSTNTSYWGITRTLSRLCRASCWPDPCFHLRLANRRYYVHFNSELVGL